MLFTPRSFAEFHIDNTLRLAERLDVWDPGSRQLREARSPKVVLEPDELDAFHEAVDMLELARIDADRLRERGNQAKLSALARHEEHISTRLSLRDPFRWIKLWQALCNERAS